MIFTILGFIGMTLILIAFIQEQRGKWIRTMFIYDSANFFGGLLLVTYGISGKAWPFVILNSIWTLYSLKDLLFKQKLPKA